MSVSAVRGAIGIPVDTPQGIADATVELLDALLHANRLDRSGLISLMFNVTADLTSNNPALALHEAGWDLPALCAQDAAFAGAPPRMIRVLAHVRWTAAGRPVPVYLGGATRTRPAISSS
ncbi:chorismate mutase [Streptomyces sp. ISL-94]|uniref:chorismate mutase n=1 Tax=Streptomyces sp. ISL-94 TaxID=2819190 RepID=UPI001BEC9483|nr:chorismate mutase [Streptomyces sp. ISL-94]MBT2479790.1 chorismate mutase [Streptomyces sp. ISL-94]